MLQLHPCTVCFVFWMITRHLHPPGIIRQTKDKNHPALLLPLAFSALAFQLDTRPSEEQLLPHLSIADCYSPSLFILTPESAAEWMNPPASRENWLCLAWHNVNSSKRFQNREEKVLKNFLFEHEEQKKKACNRACLWRQIVFSLHFL